MKTVKTGYEIVIPVLLLITGLYLFPISIFQSDFTMMPGDLGDTRFNNYILEHGYNYLTGKVENYWNAEFMYPYPDVIALSDNLLGCLPIYALFRFLSFNPDTSFQFWVLSLFALNFICCYLALRLWTGNVMLSVSGAYIYAFSIYILGHMNHIQVLPRFIIPFLFYWLYNYFSLKSVKYLLFTATGLVFQFYCGIYLGFFVTLCMVLFTLAYFLVFKDREYINFLAKSKSLMLHAGIITLSVVLISPLIVHYLSTANKLGYREFSEVFEYIPTLRSYFFASGASLTWNALSEHGVHHFKLWWNHNLFPGLIPLLAPVTALLALLQKGISSVDKKIILFLTTALVLNFIFFVRQEEFTLYKAIFHIPGMGSIRSIDRIINVQILFFIFLLVFSLKALCGVNRAANFFVYLLPLFIVSDNLIKPENVIRFNKYEARDRVDKLQDVIANKFSDKYVGIAYLPLQFYPEKEFQFHLDAMIACQKLNIPCLNSYTGKIPDDHSDFYFHMDPQGMKKWCVSQEINSDRVLIVNELGLDEINRQTVYIQTKNGNYLSAETDQRIIADKDHRDLWEEFTLFRFNENKHLFKTYNYNFVSISADGLIKYTPDLPLPNQLFELNTKDSSHSSIRSGNGNYLTLNENNSIKAIAMNSANDSSWFRLIQKK